MTQRPEIPDAIKREVRQRCGFGCVICGMPIYEYEHMLEWAVVKRHVATEITLLCPMHHAEKTKGLMPKEKVSNDDRNPFNKRQGVTPKHLLHYSGDRIKMILGVSTFSYSKIDEGYLVIPLVIDCRPIIAFRVEQGQILMSFEARNDCNETVFQIVDNAVIINLSNWDVEWVGTRLTVREGKGKIFLKIEFNAPSEIRIMRGRILFNGIELVISKNYLFNINRGDIIGGYDAIDVPLGLCLGFPMPNSAGFGLPSIPRYNIDRPAAMRKLRDFLRNAKIKNN